MSGGERIPNPCCGCDQCPFTDCCCSWWSVWRAEDAEDETPEEDAPTGPDGGTR